MNTKNFIKATLAAVGITTICVFGTSLLSCSDSSVAIEAGEEITFEEATSVLDKISDDFINTHQSELATRGFWGRLWRAVVADVKSIFHYDTTHHTSDFTIPIQDTGTASSRAFHELELVMPVYSDCSSEQRDMLDSLSAVYTYSPTKPKISDAHNAAILKMILENEWNPENTVKTVESLTRISKELGINPASQSITDIAARVDKFMSDYKASMDRYPTIPTDRNLSGLTADEISEELFNKYLRYVMNLSNPSAVSEYTNMFVECICSLNLPQFTQKDRDHISSLLELASASYDLWYHLAIMNNKVD